MFVFLHPVIAIYDVNIYAIVCSLRLFVLLFYKWYKNKYVIFSLSLHYWFFFSSRLFYLSLQSKQNTTVILYALDNEYSPHFLTIDVTISEKAAFSKMCTKKFKKVYYWSTNHFVYPKKKISSIKLFRTH